MTVAIFTASLLGAMALGMPVAFALIICGVALMSYLSILRRTDRSAECHKRRRQLPA